MVTLFADSNRARMRYIKELDAAWGVIPASGITRELRYTGSTLTPQKTTAISAEIRSDRMVPDIVETAASSSGDFNVEFSAGSHDDFMEGFVYGAWTRPMSFDTVKGDMLAWGTSAILYVNGKDVSDYFTVGHRIRTNGFLNPLNNNYFEISAITWDAGANRTEITVTTTTSIIETGSAYTDLFDANDVIVLSNAAIRAGTLGASTFDSNGGNAFAAAIAAGQLVSGQKIFVEGLGFERGTITVADPTGPALVAAGATITVNDGTNSAIFQFGGTIPATSYAVVASATDEDVTATNLAAAINALRPLGVLNVSAAALLGVVTIKNLNAVAGSITKLGDTNTAFAVVAPTGGNAFGRGFFTVESATDDVLTVTPNPGTIANTTIPVTIKGSMLRNPVAEDIVPHSFTLEVAFDDVGKFRIADGQRVSTMAYNVSAGSILTGSYGFMGREMAALTATKLGDDAAYTALDTTSTPVANATVNVGTIFMNDVPLSTALKTISFTATNNLREQEAVGNKFPVGIGAGRIDITGNVDAYFANDDLWNKFINHQTVSLGWSIQDVDGHHYEFTIPAAIFSTDTANPAGADQDIMESMAWTAKRDPVSDCMMQIDRFSCVLPTSA